jgi:hypothetical protein
MMRVPSDTAVCFCRAIGAPTVDIPVQESATAGPFDKRIAMLELATAIIARQIFI